MEKNKKPAWRRWLRRIAWGLLVLIILLGLFHRIIIFHTARYFVAQAAQEQKLDLQYDLGGTIFTSLSVTNLKAQPTAPGEIEKLEVGTLLVRYSLLGLIQHGLVDLLQEIEVRNVTVVMRPSPSPPPPKVEDRKKGKFSIPPLIPKRLNIENVNFVSHGPDGDTEIAGLVFQLDSQKPGALKVQTLNLPGIRRWDDISALATFRDRNLMLTDLSAGSEIQLKRLNLDGSKLEQNEAALALEGALLGSSTSLEARVTHLDDVKQLSARANIANLNFDEIWRYLNLHQDLHGSLSKLDLTFAGALEKPVEWTGKVDAGLSGVAWAEQPVGDVALTIDLRDGRAHVTVADRIDGQNKATLQTEAALPQKLDGFAKTSASGTVAVEVPDLAALLKPWGLAAQGDAVVRVPFQWNKSRLVADLSVQSEHLTLDDLEAKKTAFEIHVEKEFSAGEKSPLEKLTTQILGNIGSVRFKDYEADDLKLALVNHESEVTMDELSLHKGANTLRLQGRYTVPADFKSWQDVPLQVSVNLSAPELQTFVAEDSGVKLKGALQVTGQAVAQKGSYSGDFQIAAHDVQSDELVLRSVDGNLKIADNAFQITRLDAVFDDENRLNISGQAGLAAPFRYDLALDAAMMNLATFEPLLRKSGNAQELGGSLLVKWHGSGEVQTVKHSGEGTLVLTNGRFGEQKDLEAGLAAHYTPEVVDVSGLRVAAMQGEANLAAHWEKQRLQIKDIAVQLKKTPLLQGSIEMPLVAAEYKDLARLIPDDQPLKIFLRSTDVDLKKLLQDLGQKEPAISGKAQLNIAIEGVIKDLVANVAMRGSQLKSSAAANVSPADVALDLNIKDRRLKLAGSVRQPLLQAMELSGDVPLDLTRFKNPALLVPDDEPLKFSLESGEVDLKKLLQQLGQKEPSMTGKVQLSIAAEGVLKDLVAKVLLRGTKLQSTSAATIEPADLALNLDLKDKRLKLSGGVQQKLIQPLEITGDVPLDVEAMRKTKSLDGNTPVNLQVHLPKSSLAFVSSLSPAIGFIKGTAAIDVKVGGTVAAPDFGGSVEAEVAAVRFSSAGLPPLNNAVLRLSFTKDQITLQECRSGLAGGTFGASGNIKFAKITEPVFDLRVVSDKALVKQDDNITVRVSSDLKIVGPLNAGTLSGTVSATKSHFFKDIDILPIGLPGRPAPQPPAEPTVISFPNPPLRDWKFDVAIKTADPFLIQGNLADGSATSDIHLGGTGLKPWLEGSARISKLTTSLPFSKLEITSSTVYFTQDAPFVPKLNIRGTSEIRDYKVTVTIYGTASAPQAVFSSEPPLPQSEVVALLATGTTTKELASDPNALAGRAAFLVAQKYYRKWFKKDQSSQPDRPFLGHAQFDLGAVDPKTGKQSLAVRVPLSDHYVLSGGLDVGGDFRGQVKYLLRFR